MNQAKRFFPPLFVSFLFAVFFCCTPPASAQEPAPSPTPAQPSVLRVGVHDKPPLAFLDGSGVWRGIGIELWEEIAKKNGWAFQYVNLPMEDLIPALAGGKLDLVTGELVVNPVDEQVMDFSQPFIECPIRVAVSSRKWNPSWFHVLLRVFDWTLIQIFLAFVPILLVVSIIIWKLEHNHPESHFGGPPLHGVGSAFWFSAVTMTSTGFGDKVPVTFWGRTLAILWMLLSLLLMTAFTAAVASAVASARSANFIRTPDDLRHYRNGVLEDGVCSFLLHANRTPSIPYETFEKALFDLNCHKIDTVVGDTISLEYLIRSYYASDLMLLPLDLFDARIAFGLPQDSPLRDALNVSVLEELRLPKWQAIQQSYIGDRPKYLPTNSLQK